MHRIGYVLPPGFQVMALATQEPLASVMSAFGASSVTRSSFSGDCRPTSAITV